jgi:hypothetical protein
MLRRNQLPLGYWISGAPRLFPMRGSIAGVSADDAGRSILSFDWTFVLGSNVMEAASGQII